MAQQSHELRLGMSDSTRERWHKHRASRGTSEAETSPQRSCPHAHGDWEPGFFPRAAPRRHIPPPRGGKGGLTPQHPLHRRGGEGRGGEGCRSLCAVLGAEGGRQGGRQGAALQPVPRCGWRKAPRLAAARQYLTRLPPLLRPA